MNKAGSFLVIGLAVCGSVVASTYAFNVSDPVFQSASKAVSSCGADKPVNALSAGAWNPFGGPTPPIEEPAEAECYGEGDDLSPACNLGCVNVAGQSTSYWNRFGSPPHLAKCATTGEECLSDDCVRRSYSCRDCLSSCFQYVIPQTNDACDQTYP